ncbi:MAG: NAD-glutamate dehydrogenase, partial [Ghiorsea sp.]
WLKKAANAVTLQCLRDNHEQAIALSLAEETAKQHLPRLQYLQQVLYDDGRLSALQTEPSSFALRPVYAEWLGHEKNRIHQALDDALFREHSLFGDIFLNQYFPTPLRRKFTQEIASHVLGNDIAHTRISSYLLNRYGLTSIHSLQNMTQREVGDIVQALLIADALLDSSEIYERCMMQPEHMDIPTWYQAQQHILTFAEAMLNFTHIFAIEQPWLKKTKKALHAYSQQKLSLERLAALATAIPLAEKTQLPLQHCLIGMQKCLDLLPFSALEAALRTPLWASNDAHALRCEWLKRLAHLKSYAAEQMINASNKGNIQAQVHWVEHPLWQVLQHMLKQDQAENADEQRLRTILALTHLQSIIDA